MGPPQVKVWDPLVRVFHWLLVGSVLLAWLTGDDFRLPHEWLGYTMLALIGARLLWGLFGSRYARFSQFLRGPQAVIGYARQTLAGHAPRYLGHNPLGGWMVMLLMLTLAAIGLSGWMMTLDAWFGEEWVEDVHETLANGLLVLVALHVAGAVVTGLKHGENLVGAMFSGRKRAPADDDRA